MRGKSGKTAVGPSPCRLGPGAVVPDLRDGVVGRLAVLQEAARGDQHAAVGQGGGGGVPAAVVHDRGGGPGVGHGVVDAGLVQPLAVEQVPAHHHQPAVGQEGVAGAEQVDGGAVGQRGVRGVGHLAGGRVPEEGRAFVHVQGIGRLISPAPNEQLAVGQQVGVDGHVGQREHRSPLAPNGGGLHRERERGAPRGGLVGGGGGDPAVGQQEGGVMVAVRDAQVVLHHVTVGEGVGREGGGVELVVAGRGPEQHGGLGPGGVGRALEEDRCCPPATGCPGCRRPLVLVAAEDGDGRHRHQGADGVAHAGPPARLWVGGDVPGVAEVHHVESSLLSAGRALVSTR